MFSNLSKGSMFVSLKSFLLHDIMLGLQNHRILRKPQLTEDGYHPEQQIIYFLSSRKTESIRSTWPIGFSFKKLNRKMEFVYIDMTKKSGPYMSFNQYYSVTYHLLAASTSSTVN